ncbi:MAG TPA: ATP-binding protein [Bacteroidia bacterium]|jgi:hypothetical protein
MKEIVKINLDNEMDLILAHKRTLKIAELCGLGLPAQTTFATAVSEIARCAISVGEKSYLTLGINTIRLNKKEIVASIFDTVDLSKENSEAFQYAKRLMGGVHSVKHNEINEIRLSYLINFSGLISDAKIESFKQYFQTEPPISPYDEIRKKNIQLIDMANKLRQSEKQYKMLTDTLPLMMFAIDLKGELIYSNKWAQDFFNSLSLNITNSMSWQNLVHKDDYKNIWKEWDNSQLNKTTFRAQAKLVNKHGDYIWHLITIVPALDEYNNLMNWIGFFVDIHAEKLIEETLKDNKELKATHKKLEKYQDRLEVKIKALNASNHSLEQFAYIASHDLQEPLRKIKTYSHLLEDDLDLSDSQKEYFGKIIDSSDRMSSLIKDVLSYSRLSTSVEHKENTNLDELIANVLIDLELLIQEKNATVNVMEMPVLKVIPLHITQLFSNLIHNSLKFSLRTPVINISSRKLSGIEQNTVEGLNPALNYYHIKVEDNGIGFDPTYNNKIFDIFQKLNYNIYSGTGIGLSIVKKIVENHEGVIQAEGVETTGAVFHIYLPVEPEVKEE